jgi:hypothetical protein
MTVILKYRISYNFISDKLFQKKNYDDLNSHNKDIKQTDIKCLQRYVLNWELITLFTLSETCKSIKLSC